MTGRAEAPRGRSCRKGGEQRSLSVGAIRCGAGESEVARLAELRLQELVENE